MHILDAPHLRFAGLTCLQLRQSRGPKEVYVFEPHRLAFAAWALDAWQHEDKTPALLVTLDRHFDLVPPKAQLASSASLRELDDFMRWELDVRNFDHILAAMDSGLISDAILVARARPKGSFEGEEYVDRRGRSHRLLQVPTLDRLAEDYGTEKASEDARTAKELIQNAKRIVLDVDLDCFTSPCDADPTSIVPWPRELISQFLMPEGSEPFWNAVMQKTTCLTLAKEPFHCGGLLATDRLFETAAQVLFGELLQAALP